jgi:hypothetical protein
MAAIPHQFHGLILDLRTARTSAEREVEKTATPERDLLDALRLCTKHHGEEAGSFWAVQLLRKLTDQESNE